MEIQTELPIINAIPMETPTNGQTPIIVDLKDSIKVEKNTKGYNYKINVVEKPNVDLVEQLKIYREQLVTLIKTWEAEE